MSSPAEREEYKQWHLDEFAKAALIGLLAARRCNPDQIPLFHPKDDADYCYKIAHAMYERRKKS